MNDLAYTSYNLKEPIRATLITYENIDAAFATLEKDPNLSEVSLTVDRRGGYKYLRFSTTPLAVCQEIGVRNEEGATSSYLVFDPSSTRWRKMAYHDFNKMFTSVYTHPLTFTQ